MQEEIYCKEPYRQTSTELEKYPCMTQVSAPALSLNIHKTMVRCGFVVRQVKVWQVNAQSCSIDIDMSKNEQKWKL